ncbi:hypothetical protein [Ohtaekwangia sp.]|uniref:hypothetical protein n=1 Tax=Ohtaekwangia sp. TaxID=2066019 RepID=UPI002F920F69
MALLILSKDIVRVEDTLSCVTLVAYKKGLKLNLEEYRDFESRTNAEVYISRHYEEEEDFYLGIESENNVIKDYNVLNIEVKGHRFYRIAVSDQASYDHLIYDFSLEYLRLRPDHCISLYGEIFFFLDDMESLESKGGYYKGWCYKPL